MTASDEIIRKQLEAADEADKKFAGPKDFVHLHTHTIFSPLDGVATPEQYIERCAQVGMESFALTDHGSLAGLPDAYWAAKKHNVKMIAGCFLPTQDILTDRGVITMEEIQPGDMVYTHRGRWREVKNVQIREYDGNLSTVSAWNTNDVVCTSNHKLLIKHGKKRGHYKTDWVEAANVKRELFNRTYASKRGRIRHMRERWGNYLCLPIAEDDGPELIDVIKELDDNSYYKYGGHIRRSYATKYRYDQETSIPTYLKIDGEFLWVCGMFLGDGNFKKNADGITGITFSLGPDEIGHANRIQNYFKEFDINTSVYDRRNNAHSRNYISVEVHSTIFGKVFRSLFGEYAKNKAVPYRWMNLPKQKCQQLLMGLFDSDGKWNDEQAVLKMTSKTMVWQARLMLAKIGCASSITTVGQTGHGTRNSYSIRWRQAGSHYHDYDDKHVYLPVKSNETKQYKGRVFNIEVEEDHSYYIGVAVKNCEIYLNDYHQDVKRKLQDVKLSALKMTDPELVERYRRNRHLTVICKNMTGYKNLLSLMREGYEMGLYYNRPRIWLEQLKKYREGLIVLSGCLNGPVCHELRKGSECRDLGDKEGARRYYKMATDYVKTYRDIFGEDFYLEVQMPGETIERGKEVFFQTMAIAKKMNIQAAMTGDIHYLHRADFDLQKTMMAVDQGTTVDDPNLFHVDSDEGFFKTRAQFRQTFVEQQYDKYDPIGAFEKACDVTVAIAEKCEAFSPDLSPKLPEIEDADGKLKKLVAEALIRKGLNKNKDEYLIDGQMVTYTKQVKIELQRIVEKRFSSYFLITRNLVRYAKTNSWDVGPARGSAGGSLVCYLLGIHDMDPLKWGLSFDRFLSPSRGGFMLKCRMSE